MNSLILLCHLKDRLLGCGDIKKKRRIDGTCNKINRHERKAENY